MNPFSCSFEVSSTAYHYYDFNLPFHSDALCKFCWNWPSGLREVQNVKSLQTDGLTDDVKNVIRNVHFSFQLRWVKKIKIGNHENPHSWGWWGWSDTYPVSSVSLIKFLVFLWGGVYRIYVQLSYDFSFTMFTDEII